VNTPEAREDCATRLLANQQRVSELKAFVGLDGFVDEIFHVVDKRESADKYVRLPTISQFSSRLAGAAGKSANVECVSQITKLGGNGPIMGNALASFGLRVTYLGNLGYPNLHPIFADFARRAEVHSIAEPGYTDALEFEDGKIMLGKHQSLRQVNWENIKSRFGLDKLTEQLCRSDLVGFVNWTMLTSMSDIWSQVLKEVCPKMQGSRRKLFFDLADPQKRTAEDISGALKLIVMFHKYFDVILGLNEKESHEIADVLELKWGNSSPDALVQLAQDIRRRLPVDTIVIHPTSCAAACGPDGAFLVEGPLTQKPKITTGAGDHFNSGFCLGKLLGFTTPLSLLTGVTTSGYYVRTAESPGVPEVAGMLRNWPVA
jgi:sugar/nucleoside kinase (ribokinase family)